MMDVVQLAIQGGSVGVAIYAIFVLQKIVTNHISHNTISTEKLCEAVTEMTTLLRMKL